jgi:hypothetical protein
MSKNSIIVLIYDRHRLLDLIYIVGFAVFTAVVMKSIIFWDMTPCSPLGFDRGFVETYCLHLQGQRNRFSKPASKEVEAICSSETSVETQRTTRPHIPEDDTLIYINCINCQIKKW